MHVYTTRRERTQTTQNKTDQPEFLRLPSEPVAKDYLPGTHLGRHYQSRYLAKRSVMRTIRRMRHS